MREIKGRSWVPKLKQFFYWGFGDISGNGSYWTSPPSTKDQVPGLFTGKYDRNGKEIYEGDIMTHPDFAEGTKLVVEYLGGVPCLSGWDCIRTKFELGEVVGNVWENPGPLEVKE